MAASGSVAGTTVAGPPSAGHPAVDRTASLAQAAATVCEFDGQDVTADNIALTSFHVSGPTDPPEDGQGLAVSFVLENVGQQTASFDSVLLRADTPAGSREYTRVSSVSLAPGEAFTHETDVFVTEGDWVLWPAYVTANGQSSPSPWQPCDFAVQPAPDTEPPAIDVDLSPLPPVADDEAVTFTVTTTDVSAIDEIVIDVDGRTRQRCTSSPCSITVGPLEPGTHDYRVEAADAAGNRGETAGSFDVTQHVSPLSVEVDYYVPPPNTTLDTVVVAQAFGDVPVETLTIVVDGEPAKTCSSPTCRYETRLAPGTEHTIGATVEDESGGIAESLGGVEGTTIDVPGTGVPAIPIVNFHYPLGDLVFERPDRLAFDVVAGDELRRVELFGFEGNVSASRTLCGPGDAAPACPDGAFSYDETFPYGPGWNPIAVGVDTDSGIHLNAVHEVTYIDPATIEVWANATHDPSSPSPGEPVTIRARAAAEYNTEAISSLEVRRLSFTGDDPVLERCAVEPRAGNLTCAATYDPPDGRHVIYYYAVASVAGGREVTTDPRPVVFDDGPDRDDDGLTDYEEAFLCTDERNPDTDGDALLDGWETYGHHFPDGHVVDLPAMGAHPCQPDVFLEIDWWENRTHTHRPSPYTLQTMKQAFRRGGVHLHIDAGKWGGGEATPHHDLLDFPPDYYYENGYEYKLRKADHFDPHRLWTFHYAVFRHRDGRSVYMYANSVNIQTPDGAAWDFETSELFHEFGHSIGLGHGGRRGERVQRRNGDLVTYYGRWDAAPNRRPNYLSSMNYLYYGTVYWNPDEEAFVRSYDYSRADLPDLDESDLDERPDSAFARALRDYPLPDTIDERPFGVSDNWIPVVRYGCVDPDETERVLWYDIAKPVIMVSDGRQTIARKVAGEPWQYTGLPEHPPGIDWNCDGAIEASVEMNVNGDGGDRGLLDSPSNYTRGEVLRGREDWSSIPNRHPCPGDQQTQRSIPGSDEKYDVAPAPDDAFIARGHDPPCDEVSLAPAGSLAPPDAGLGASADRPAHKPITEEGEEILPAEFCNLLDDDGDGDVDEGCLDGDGDGFPDEIDNCPAVANPAQTDTDGDYIGDACAGVPAAPDGLDADRDGDSVRLSWEPVSGTSGYAIWRRPAPDAPLEYVGGYPTATTETFVDEAADPDQSVTYVVRAVNAMTGTEGRAAMVTYDPDAADTSPSGDGGPSVLPGGLPAPLVGGLAVAVLVVLGAGLYLRRRSG